MRLSLPSIASILFAFSMVACAATYEDEIVDDGAATTAGHRTTSIRPSTDPKFRRLPTLDERTRIKNDQDLELTLYQSVAEVASNGTRLILNASNDGGAGALFDLGIRFNSLNEATMRGPGVVRLAGTFDRAVEGGTEPATFEATVALTMDDRAIGQKAVVTFNGEAREITASDDSGSRFLRKISTMHRAESIAELAATVYEADLGGNDTTSRSRLLLAVMNEKENATYDLGVFVNRVTKVEFIRDFALRIEAVERSGETGSSRVTYEAELSFDGDRPDIVRLTRIDD
jgi:hypothetical protein